MRSAAWRLSLWATLAFAVGTTLVFLFLQRFVANDIQRRSDAWLSGEVEVLGDVAQHTPKGALYNAVVEEVAELASKEIPNHVREEGHDERGNDSVFFLQTGPDGALTLWVGAGNGAANLAAIRTTRMVPDRPLDLRIAGFETPFRVAMLRTQDGGRVYLGLSERDELRVLRSLRGRFVLLWVLIVLLGFTIVFYSTRRMLGHVREITEAASRIGQAGFTTESDLSSRVPTTQRNDEVSQLAITLNHMLERIESSMHQLHTITDSLAHDLRSPLTAIRGKLEVYLSSGIAANRAEPIVSVLEELDRLSEFLNKSLDVAEAKADALRLSRIPIELDELIRVMIDLYEPSMSDRGLRIQLSSGEPVTISGDAALVHRMISNLFDNELKHLPPGSTVTMRLRREDDFGVMTVEDDGPGFAPEMHGHMFERRVKSDASSGHGLGLAFVDAVVRAHGGTVTAANRPEGGAQIILHLPLATDHGSNRQAALALASEP